MGWVARADGAQFRWDGKRYGYVALAAVRAPSVELTPAERDVVQLVARGLTNRDIAARRRVSIHTVGNQLAAVYGKLGMSSRYELIAWLAGADRDP